MFGRVAMAQTMREISVDLMDMLGAASALPTDTPGSADDGTVEYLFRLALPAGIYGGTPGGVPQHDRPARARAGPSCSYPVG